MGKPPPEDKTLGIETDICFYELEGGDGTAEGEEAEILIIVIKASRQPINTYINPLDKGIHIW